MLTIDKFLQQDPDAILTLQFDEGGHVVHAQLNGSLYSILGTGALYILGISVTARTTTLALCRVNSELESELSEKFPHTAKDLLPRTTLCQKGGNGEAKDDCAHCAG